MADTAKHIFYSGRVQGVGFRFTAHRIASRYDLTGFVRNMTDGRVEMLVQGSEQDVDDCLEDIADTFGDSIRNSQVENEELSTDYDGFNISL